MIKNTFITNKQTKYKISIRQYLPENEFKEVFIICHGFSSNKNRPAVDIIAKKLLEFSIASVAFDFPSHGRSPVSNAFLSVNNCMQDIICVANYINKKYKVEKVSLFGTSFGGYIILNTLSRFDYKFDKIVLRSPAINMKDILVKKLIDINIDEYKRSGCVGVGYMKKLEVPYNFYIDLCNNDLLKFNNKIRKNILIIHGKQDKTADIKDTYAFMEQNKCYVDLIEIPQADHIMSTKEMFDIADYLINYVRKVNNEF